MGDYVCSYFIQYHNPRHSYEPPNWQPSSSTLSSHRLCCPKHHWASHLKRRESRERYYNSMNIVSIFVSFVCLPLPSPCVWINARSVWSILRCRHGFYCGHGVESRFRPQWHYACPSRSSSKPDSAISLQRGLRQHLPGWRPPLEGFNPSPTQVCPSAYSLLSGLR